MTASPRSFFPGFVFVFIVATPLSALLGFANNVHAESPMPHTTHTTMVVFSDRSLDDGQWTALVSELHRAQAAVAAFVPVIGPDIDVDVQNGRDVKPGMAVQQSIEIFLKGDCRLMPRSRIFVQGALGWVNEIRGRIQPFIHVDCERIVEMLGPLALGMNNDRRDTVMAKAMARVILHEWVHIAAQKSTHGSSGITQPVFNVRDLLARDEQIYPRERVSCDRKRSSGF